MTSANPHEKDRLVEVRADGRRVYDGHVVSVDVDCVRLTDGTEAIREVVRHAGAVVVVALTEEGEIVLERQFRYAVGAVLTELPAGKLGAGEDPLACAQRELVEETGFQARDWRPLGTFYTAPGFSDERMHAFLALGAAHTAECSLDDDERIEVILMPFGEALERVRRGEIHDAKSIVGLTLAQLHR